MKTSVHYDEDRRKGQGQRLRISPQSIEAVRETANVVEVASEFTALRRQGTRYTGLCPYPDHSEKTPSFSVTPNKGFYYCFGCSKGGDAIKLVSDIKNLSFVEAVTYIAERTGIELEFEGRSREESAAAKKRNQRRRDAYKALAAAAVYYHKYLLKSSRAEQAREYLEGRRITHSTIKEFRLGYAPPRGSSGFIEAARRAGLGFDRGVFEAAGLLSRGGDRFAGRITFPISDRRGRIIGFGARSLGDDQPKYLNSPETDLFSKRELLYGFPQVADSMRREGAALVVEGYTDVLMLYQSGIKNAVATLGTALTPGHIKSLSREADRIYVLFDPDAAGEKAIERATSTAIELKVDLFVMRLSEDPADWLLEHRPEEFTELLSGAVPILEYGIRRIVDRNRGASATARSRAVPEIKNLMQEIKDPIVYREAVRLVSEALAVSPQELRRMLCQKEPDTPTSNGERPDDGSGKTRSSHAAPSDPLEHAGRQVLACMVARPDLTLGLLRNGLLVPPLTEPLFLGPDDFVDATQAEIFTLLQDHPSDGLDAALADERARPLMDEFSALAVEGEKLYPSAASVRENWVRLRILRRERAKKEARDQDHKERLLAEIKTLRDALRAVPTRWS